MASSTTSPGPIPVYGQVTVDGQQYIERPQIFVADVNVDTPLQVQTNLRLTLPGNADFLLKGLGRDFTKIPPFGSAGNPIFRFRLVNAEGTTWFFSGGLGIFDDRVISSLCFGDSQFPFPLIPPVPIHATGSLIYEVEDIGVPFPAAGRYPYVLHLAFYGAYLIPATGGGHGTGPLAFSGD